MLSYGKRCPLLKCIIEYAFSLRQMRAKVWKARTTTTLFDIKQYCTDMEDLFYKMWSRFEKGEAPDHITE